MSSKRRKMFSTHQIADLIGVSDQSISNWIDAGQLPAERTPGGHRRVRPEDLMAFLRDRQMHVPEQLQPDPPVVLVVDDEPELADWLAGVIADRLTGLRTAAAYDGFDAGRIVATQRPAVVLLDLYMPGLDGFETCRRIKGDPQTAATKVVAMTAFHSEEAEQAAEDAGADAYLPKPPDLDLLADLLSRLVAKPA